ncbi:MAG: hypothetical protein KH268_06250 [Clostridiales bacterium]|nr:hypothetical protein [Clostridiales bacterium]
MGVNEMLFYGGIALAIFSLAAAGVFYFLFKRKWKRLQEEMNQEYGYQK